jgi:HD-like signal output (HDOD) protein
MLVVLLGLIDKEWKVEGFVSSVKALERVKAEPPDVLISDQCMPDMPGEQLLEQVWKISPETIRIIISGYVGPGKLSKIPSAHQYIEKPFALHRISSVIRQTFEAQELIKRLNIHDIVVSLHALPTMPPSYHRLLNALDNPNGSNEMIAQIIATDPNLTSRIIKLANSSFYAREVPVTNPLEAVLCLGSEIIKAIVISEQTFSQFISAKSAALQFARNWDHCWATGQLAYDLAIRRGMRGDAPSEAYLAGLLHELGEVALYENFPDKFQAACSKAKEKKQPLFPALQEVFGVNPAYVTAYLLTLWGISKNVVNAALYLNNPSEERASGFNITTVLYIANGLAVRRDPFHGFAIADWDMPYLQRMGAADLVSR